MLRNILIYINFMVVAIVLASCTNNPKAPVRDAFPGHKSNSATTSSAMYHTVEPGDGLYRISLKYGVSIADLARWNNLNDTNAIVVGQILRVSPPVTNEASPELNNNEVIVNPTTHENATIGSNSSANYSGITWFWPTRSGAVIQPFSEQSRGISIDGKLGDPIFAAADGTVVFAGSSVPGLGNLVIIQHNKDYLSAYAHNSSLKVTENQKVRAGDTIAEMGSSDTTMVKLHFEIREKGRAINPLNLLPKR